MMVLTALTLARRGRGAAGRGTIVASRGKERVAKEKVVRPPLWHVVVVSSTI